MIRPLRRRHRRMIAVLGIVVPLGFAWGLLVRQSVPPADVTFGEAGVSLAGFDVVARTDLLLGATPVSLTWRRPLGDPSRLAVTLEPRGEPRQPDLLAYWGGVDERSGLPADAILLGRVRDGSSTSWLVPEATSGGLILYSVAKREIVARAAMPSDGAAP